MTACCQYRQAETEVALAVFSSPLHHLSTVYVVTRKVQYNASTDEEHDAFRVMLVVVRVVVNGEV